MITKKIYFSLEQATRRLDKDEYLRVIGEGDEDDIYTWVTSLPDAVLGPVPDGATRSESFYSFEKFGYMKNLPAKRR